MTDEEKVVVEDNRKECHCECGKILTKFLLGTTSIFLGVLLAILVASALLRPKMPGCPCKMMKHHPGIERRLPPPGAAIRRHEGQQRPDFKKFEGGQRPDFTKQQRPEK